MFKGKHSHMHTHAHAHTHTVVSTMAGDHGSIMKVFTDHYRRQALAHAITNDAEGTELKRRARHLDLNCCQPALAQRHKGSFTERFLIS